METKVCRLCSVEKVLSEFRFRKDNNKHRSECKVCQRQHDAKYRKENRDAVRAGVKRWHEENQDRVKEYRVANFKRTKFHSMMKKYGVSEDMFYERLLFQSNKCAICLSDFTENTNPYVDHCHSSGIFRGLLCMTCNTGLGHFRDNVENLERATKYLKDYGNKIEEVVVE